MPDSPRSSAFCAKALPDPSAPSLPDTAEALRALHGAEDLDLDLGGLALLGTLFDDCQVITRNNGALVQERGGYAAFQPFGSEWKVSQSRITMRIFEHQDAVILRNRADPATRSPAAISMADAAGRIRHRVQVFSDADWLTAGSVDRLARPVQPVPPPPVSNVVSLAAVRHARLRWARADLGEHLDAVARTGGQRDRMEAMRHIGPNWARRVATGLLPSFLAFLCDRKIGFSASVPVEGLVQTLCGQGRQSFGHAQGVMICQTDRGLFSLDMAQVAQVWVTRHADDRRATFGAALEIYDAQGDVLAVLHCDPWSEADTWNGYLEAMPSAR